MWDEIDVVPMRRPDQVASPHALRELGLLVIAAIIAVLLPLIG